MKRITLFSLAALMLAACSKMDLKYGSKLIAEYVRCHSETEFRSRIRADTRGENLYVNRYVVFL